MYNHAPDEYRCPFCLVASQQADPAVETCPDDIVYATDQATAFISSRWWPYNPGHVIVIPNQHYENIYDLPLSAASAIHALAREIAVAMKQQYRCPGISTRQHNEPAGNQDVWHYHLHVFPRYHDDRLYHSQHRRTILEERQPYAFLFWPLCWIWLFNCTAKTITVVHCYRYTQRDSRPTRHCS